MADADESRGPLDGRAPAQEEVARDDAQGAVVAEEQRVSGELLRDDAKRDRGSAETRRERAEERREHAERGRDDSERYREQAERAREAAEAAREAAEAAREETMALRAAFHDQLAIMREMQETLRALERRLGQPAPPTVERR